MPRMRRKDELPVKTCAQCGKPFIWRKKWERVWDEGRVGGADGLRGPGPMTVLLRPSSNRTSKSTCR